MSACNFQCICIANCQRQRRGKGRVERWGSKSFSFESDELKRVGSGCTVGYNNNNNDTKAHKCTCICMHSHTHTRTQTLPRCRLKNLLAALPAAQHSRRAVGSAALLWWVYCAGCLEVWQQQQRRCDVVGDKDSEIHVILFLPKTTHNKDVNKTHKHNHPEHTPTHTRTASLTNEI